MSSLVIGHSLSLFRALRKLTLDTAYDSLSGLFEVNNCHTLAVTSSCNDGTLVANIHDVGAREAWCQSSYLASVLFLSKLGITLDFSEMNIEDLLSLFDRWQNDFNLTIEATRA